MVNQSNLMAFLEENQHKPELETLTFEDYFKTQLMETNEFLSLPISKYETNNLENPKYTDPLTLMQTPKCKIINDIKKYYNTESMNSKMLLLPQFEKSGKTKQVSSLKSLRFSQTCIDSFIPEPSSNIKIEVLDKQCNSIDSSPLDNNQTRSKRHSALRSLRLNFASSSKDVQIETAPTIFSSSKCDNQLKSNIQIHHPKKNKTFNSENQHKFNNQAHQPKNYKTFTPSSKGNQSKVCKALQQSSLSSYLKPKSTHSKQFKRLRQPVNSNIVSLRSSRGSIINTSMATNVSCISFRRSVRYAIRSSGKSISGTV